MYVDKNNLVIYSLVEMLMGEDLGPSGILFFWFSFILHVCYIFFLIFFHF